MSQKRKNRKKEKKSRTETNKKDCGNEKMLRRATEKEQEEKEKDQTKIKQKKVFHISETLIIS